MIDKIENRKQKASKLVFDAKAARKLCKAGFPIIDIKPYRDNPDKTVFVFDNTEEFQNALSGIIEEMNDKKKAVESEDVEFEYCD